MTIACNGCGALVNKIEGIPHKYIGASAGCWSLYEEVLAKEYGEYNYPQLTHRLTVDTYAIQHPGVPERKSIQSVNIHLISLFLILEKKMNGELVTKRMSAILSKEPDFQWLDPPIPNGQITIVDVLTAKNLQDHKKKVRIWAKDVWASWYHKHGAAIEKIIENFT